MKNRAFLESDQFNSKHTLWYITQRFITLQQKNEDKEYISMCLSTNWHHWYDTCIHVFVFVMESLLCHVGDKNYTKSLITCKTIINLIVSTTPVYDMTLLGRCKSICRYVNTLRPRRNEQHFADDIFKRIFFNENVWISIKISLKFVPKGPIYNIPALV